MDLLLRVVFFRFTRSVGVCSVVSLSIGGVDIFGEIFIVLKVI